MVGEFVGRSSPVGVCQLCQLSLWVNARIWIWIIKNTLKLNLAHFNMYNIHTMYRRVHWTSVLEIRDTEQQDRMSVSFKYLM
jgi:hypothetical protein